MSADLPGNDTQPLQVTGIVRPKPEENSTVLPAASQSGLKINGIISPAQSTPASKAISVPEVQRDGSTRTTTLTETGVEITEIISPRARKGRGALSPKAASEQRGLSQKATAVEGLLLEEEAPARKKPRTSLMTLIIKGLWKENPGLCQLLGMCPLLAVTTTAASALGLGIATTLVVVLSSLIISLLRKFILKEVRIPLYVALIATLVTVVRFEVEARFPALYDQLGIYLALIVTNCIIMGRAEAFAGRNGPVASAVDALACGVGFSLVLFVLGSLREILGSGTFFMGASELLGDWALSLEMTVLSAEHTYLIAILPPGGFFILALLIALKNALDARHQARAQKRFSIRHTKI